MFDDCLFVCLNLLFVLFSFRFFVQILFVFSDIFYLKWTHRMRCAKFHRLFFCKNIFIIYKTDQSIIIGKLLQCRYLVAKHHHVPTKNYNRLFVFKINRINENQKQSTIRIASAMKGTSSRLTTNPGVSRHVTTDLPIFSPNDTSVRVVDSLVFEVDTTFCFLVWFGFVSSIIKVIELYYFDEFHNGNRIEEMQTAQSRVIAHSLCDSVDAK